MSGRDTLTDLPGQIVDGKYRVEALLGRGGMGAVFRAVHLGTDRTVAVKVITPAMADQAEYLARFSREARACGRLRHPGIVDVTDFGIATHHGHPLAYLVMEFLDGSTLADALRQEPRPPMTWVIDILEEVCSAVEEAHRHGILHRDLKPENIWLEPNRRGGFTVKVLDFGLAKMDGAEVDVRLPTKATRALVPAAADVGATLAGTIEGGGATLAQTFATGGCGESAMSTVSGTPAYMSPEQTRGGLVTTRSDVYSIGVIAYRMIAGRLPFEGSPVEVLSAQINLPPPPLRALRPDVHQDAEKLVAAALSKDPAERPASAGVFGNMLAAQLEPAGTFFRRATLLVIDHLGTFLRVGLIACAPLLLLGLLLGISPLATRVGMPPLGSSAGMLVLLALAVLSMLSQMALGSISLFVVHAIAAPLRPLEVRSLLRRYAPRLRRWARAMTPYMIAMGTFVLLMAATPLTIGWIGPWVRPFPRPVRLLIVLPLAIVPIAAAWYALLKRKGLGIRETGCLAAVMLVEDLPFQAATRRSAELTRKAGALRAAVQRWYLAVLAVAAGLLGAYVGGKGGATATAQALAFWMPLVAVGSVVFLTVNAVFNSLMYLSARRATGESMEDILANLESTRTR